MGIIGLALGFIAWIMFMVTAYGSDEKFPDHLIPLWRGTWVGLAINGAVITIAAGL